MDSNLYFAVRILEFHNVGVLGQSLGRKMERFDQIMFHANRLII